MPLGNPPLYVGLLRGVPFFWPATHLLPHFLLRTGAQTLALQAISAGATFFSGLTYIGC
jgi:Putative citrate transport